MGSVTMTKQSVARPAVPAEEDGIRLTPEEQRRRRNRSVAIALILVGLVITFYLVTIVKLGGNIAERTF